MATASRASERTRPAREERPYERAASGFRNYWYPACTAGEVSEKPRSLKLLGDQVMLIRRNGSVHAVIDECPHRGTPLSAGKWEFRGTPTITCRYHGWTIDVTDGRCVAVLCEGPDSEVPGRVRIRTYPVQERKGIVWIWMGRGEPVPLEEDVPALMLRNDTVVKVRRGVKYGNWRWHAENVGAGHAIALHRDTIGLLFNQFPSHPVEPSPIYSAPDDDDGQWLLQSSKGQVAYEDYPGLGRWPKARPWRRSGGRPKPVQGLSHGGAALRLPGLTRVINFPFNGCIYYEWYVPVDEDHYAYFQVASAWPRNPLSRLRFEIEYYLFGKPFKMTLFNNQDVRMVRHTTDYVKRKGMDYLTPLSRQDHFHIEWRDYANRAARGEATPVEDAKVPAAAEAERAT